MTSDRLTPPTLPGSAPFGKSDGVIVRQESPFNGGPDAAHLRDFHTPNDLFFVRNHGDVPEIDEAAYRLAVAGLVERPLALSPAELRALPLHRIDATLQCAGNRREEMAAHAPIPHELPWGTEAVSNAEWGGARLADVLALCGLRAGAAHVELIGLDETERLGHRFRYGSSIPLAKASSSEVLLAYEMNGEPLPAVHGAPLRAVVPGYIGARSVKWLGRIELRSDPSENYFQAKAYRLFPASTGPETVVWDEGLMLGELNLNSVICGPDEGANLSAGEIEVWGWATPGGGRTVSRVELSVDGGQTWRRAEVLDREEEWTWRHWRAALDLPVGEHEIVCRAWDSAAQTQPEHAGQVWNFKGYMNNAWHRVRVTCHA